MNQPRVNPATSGDNRGPLISDRSLRLLLAGILIAATLLLYGPVVHHDFINFDDPQYISFNRHVVTGLSLRNVEWAFRSIELGNWHPLAWISHMLDCQLFGENPAGHHYSSVLFHTANALLLFFLLLKVTGYRWRSFVVAALFAVHPLNVENVAWVAERKTLLSAFFCLLMLAAYGWYAKSPGLIRYLAVVAAFVLALLSKSMAVTMPLTLLLLDYWPLDRLATPGESLASAWPRALKLIAEKIPLFLISAAFSVIAVIAQHTAGAIATALPLTTRLQNAAIAYVAYMQKAVWPTNLAIYYPFEQYSMTWAKLVISLVVLLAITALTFHYRRQRYLTFGWLLYLSALLPVIGIIQIGGQAMADRYTYTPFIGLFIIVVWGVADLVERFAIPRPLIAAATLVALAGFAFATHNYLAYWHDSLTLFTKAQQVAGKPDRLIETNIGVALNDMGRSDEALPHFQTAIALDPQSAYALYNVATYKMKHGQAQESLPLFQSAILHSNSEMVTRFAFNNLGSAYLRLGDFEHAERAYTASLHFDPEGYVPLIGRGQAFYGEGKFEQAAADFSSVLHFGFNPRVSVWLGKSLQAQQKFEPAIAAYSAALNADPSNAEAKSGIAAIRSRQPAR